MINKDDDYEGGQLLLSLSAIKKERARGPPLI